MKIEYSKTIRSEELLKPFVKESEPKLTNIYTNFHKEMEAVQRTDILFKDLETKKAYVVKNTYDLEGIHGKLVDLLRTELMLKGVVSERRGKFGIDIEIRDNIEYLEIDMRVGLNKNDPKDGKNSRQMYSFNEDYMLTQIGTQINKGLFTSTKLPVYAESQILYVTGNIFYENINGYIDMIDIYDTLNAQGYTYNQFTTKQLEQRLMEKSERKDLLTLRKT